MNIEPYNKLNLTTVVFLTSIWVVSDLAFLIHIIDMISLELMKTGDYLFGIGPTLLKRTWCAKETVV